MLTTLGVLLAYLVMHAEGGAKRKWLHWSLYMLAATAAVYTHYFAFFLLLALAITFFLDQLFILPRRGARVEIASGEAQPHLVRGPVIGFTLANVAMLGSISPLVHTALHTVLGRRKLLAGPI